MQGSAVCRCRCVLSIWLHKLTSNVFIGWGGLALRESGPHRFCLAQAAFVLPIVLLLTPCFSRERGPRIEVVCPSPPIPVAIGNNKVLVYELHVTNFDTVPLTLKRIEIFATQVREPLATLVDDKLSAAMTRVGGAMSMSGGSGIGAEGTRRLDPGGRNVVFVWIELPANHTVPTSLRHRMIFSSKPAGDGKPSDATLDDFPVLVGQESAEEHVQPELGADIGVRHGE